MEALEIQNMYDAFYREHRAAITEELKKEYAKYREHPISTIIRSSDFGAFVGFPLLLLGGAWIVSATKANSWIVTGITVAFGFWLRYYQKHIINLTCRYFFDRSRGAEVLSNYVDKCESNAIQQAPHEKHEDLCRFYEYCRKELPTETFRYYK